jgi:hypothetical protein
VPIGHRLVASGITLALSLAAVVTTGALAQAAVPAALATGRTLGTLSVPPAASPAASAYGTVGTVVRTRTTTRAAWKLEVFSVCQSSPVRVLSGMQAQPGELAVHWDQKRADGHAALPGPYRLVLSSSTGALPAQVSYVVSATTTSPLGPCPQAARLAPSTRYAASVQAGRLAAPTSRTVVLAPGDDAGLPEALIAAPLAAVKGAPRLLTTATTLPAVVAADITRRKATRVYVVGSVRQVSRAVVARLRALGVRSVVRLTGADRATTAAAVARAMGVRGAAVAV